MVYTTCNNCGHGFHWEWVEAFSKFGFKDGDGKIETHNVAFALEESGYTVKYGKWGLHNILIYALRKGDIEYMPDALSDIVAGYDNPREFLTKEIIELLDNAFPTTSTYDFP